jgi:CRP-like cAMP-binding protein
MISPSLKSKISKHMNHDALVNNNILGNNDEVIKVILNDLKTLLSLPEDEIIRQNEVGDKMYFIAKGECEVLVTDENSAFKTVKSLTKGHYFGEVALLKNCKRTATVKSKNYSTLAELHRAQFDQLLLTYPTIKESMEQFIAIEYSDKWMKFQKRALRNIDYLNTTIPDKVIDELIYKLEQVTVTQDTLVFRSGTPCKSIYIISNGELDIYVNNNNKDTYLDTLYTGCVVGSYSSLTSDYYTITGKAKTDLKLLQLDFTDILSLRQQFDELDNVMHDYESY